MKPTILSVSFVCLVISILAALGLTENLFAQNTQRAEDEATLKSLITNYYGLYGKQDLAGMKKMWSARSPALEALSLPPAAEYRFSNLYVSRIQVEHDSAKLRASFD